MSAAVVQFRLIRAWETVVRTGTYRITTVTNVGMKRNYTNLRASNFASNALRADWIP